MSMNSSRSETLLSRYREILKNRETDQSEPLAVFCRSHGISIGAYYYWKKKLSKSNDSTPPEKAKTFIPVSIRPSAPLGATYEIHLDNATRLVLRSGFDQGEVAALVRILWSKDCRCLA